MYVCVCHALNDKDLHEALGKGAASAADVHRHFGVSTRCGRCVPFIDQIVGARPNQAQGSDGSSPCPCGKR